MRLEDLLSLSNRMFEKKGPVNTLMQTQAEHFMPERADFTVTRSIGDEMADHLIDSYPILLRRDLGDSFSAMLRDGTDWAQVYVMDDPGYAGNDWLQRSSARLMRLFTDHRSGFTRATKQGDHDFATFGQCVLSVEPNRLYNGILVRNWHMRDCAWADNEAGAVDHVHRKWAPSLMELKRTFGEGKLHAKHLSMLSENPIGTVNIRHIVMPSDMYGKGEFERYEYVSVFVDADLNHVLEEKGINYCYYIVPRFQTIAGSPYAYSPAAVAGLPNARALQAMTFTLMEAAERYARPPIIATQQATRSDIDLGPDGITWVDKNYDEKMGAALRPMYQDRGGWPIGKEMRQGVVDVLASCFYNDRLNLPEFDREVTAFEIDARMKQYRRQNLPLFAPMEREYNGQLCEAAFRVAMTMGLMGSPYDIPPSLKGQEVDWKFKTPLTDAEEEKKIRQYQQNSEMLAAAVAVDASVANDYDVKTAFRDAVAATGSPVRWLRDMREVTRRDGMQAQLALTMAQQQGAEAA